MPLTRVSAARMTERLLDHFFAPAADDIRLSDTAEAEEYRRWCHDRACDPWDHLNLLLWHCSTRRAKTRDATVKP